jgi:hypothetical protein
MWSDLVEVMRHDMPGADSPRCKKKCDVRPDGSRFDKAEKRKGISLQTELNINTPPDLKASTVRKERLRRRS